MNLNKRNDGNVNDIEVCGFSKLFPVSIMIIYSF